MLLVLNQVQLILQTYLQIWKIRLHQDTMSKILKKQAMKNIKNRCDFQLK